MTSRSASGMSGPVHALDAGADDRPDLVREGRVVCLHGRHGRGQQQTVAILVLEALAEQRRAPCRGAHQEPACAHVGRLPDEVADALEPEHRIEGVEGDHRYAARGIAGGCSHEARHRARLGDALLQDLPVGVLGVRQQQVVVDRFVLLTLAGVDLELLEQRVHAERAPLVGDDRHDPLAHLGVAAQVPQQAREAHRGRHRVAARAGAHLCERLRRGEHDRPPDRGRAARHRAAQRAPPLHHVLIFDRTFGRPEVRVAVFLERRLGDLVVHVQPVAEFEQLLLVHLLDLVRGVAALEARPERPALDRLGEDHRRTARAEVLDRGLVRRVQLAVVVPAAGQVA